MLDLRLDKEDLRRRAPLASVCAALGILVRDDRAICPFHDDHSPSMHVVTGTDRGGQPFQYARCFVCGYALDCFDLVRRVNACTLGHAVRFVADVVDSAPPLELERPVTLDAEALASYVTRARANVTRSDGMLSVAADLRSASDPRADSVLLYLGWGVDDNYCVVMPHWTAAGNLVGAKIRALDGQKWAFPGSMLAGQLYGAWLTPLFPGRHCLITEGETDFAFAFMQRTHAHVLSLPTGASAAPPNEYWVEQVRRFEAVYLAFDGDDPGRDATLAWTERFSQSINTLTIAGGLPQLYVCPVPWGQDLRSWGGDVVDLMAEARRVA